MSWKEFASGSISSLRRSFVEKGLKFNLSNFSLLLEFLSFIIYERLNLKTSDPLFTLLSILETVIWRSFFSPHHLLIDKHCIFLSTSKLFYSFQFSFLMAVFLSKIFVYKTSCSFSSAGCMKNVIFHCLTTNLCQNHLWRPRFVLEFCDAIKTQNRDLTSRSHGFFLIWPFSISLVFKFSMFSFFSFSNLCFLSFLP